MKDYLLDILKHTHNLGLFEFVRVSGTDDLTKIDAVTEDKNLILMATTLQPVTDFNGTFGLPNLSKLDMLLKCKEYQENADITLQTEIRNGQPTPVSVRFINEAKDFKNEYRLMNQSVLDEKIKLAGFKAPKWDAEFSPNAAGIMRINFQSSLLSEEANFTLRTDQGNVVCNFGDSANHAGEFNFATNATGKIDANMLWPVKYFLPILKLYDNSNFTIKVNNSGLMELGVNSGLGQYNFYVLATAK
jgi:hypothetical protein